MLSALGGWAQGSATTFSSGNASPRQILQSGVGSAIAVTETVADRNNKLEQKEIQGNRWNPTKTCNKSHRNNMNTLVRRKKGQLMFYLFEWCLRCVICVVLCCCVCWLYYECYFLLFAPATKVNVMILRECQFQACTCRLT